MLASCGMCGCHASVRQARLKAPEGHDVAYYHCISRVVNREFVLGEEEREQSVEIMRCYEHISGIWIGGNRGQESNLDRPMVDAKGRHGPKHPNRTGRRILPCDGAWEPAGEDLCG